MPGPCVATGPLKTNCIGCWTWSLAKIRPRTHRARGRKPRRHASFGRQSLAAGTKNANAASKANSCAPPSTPTTSATCSQFKMRQPCTGGLSCTQHLRMTPSRKATFSRRVPRKRRSLVKNSLGLIALFVIGPVAYFIFVAVHESDPQETIVGSKTLSAASPAGLRVVVRHRGLPGLLGRCA